MIRLPPSVAAMAWSSSVRRASRRLRQAADQVEQADPVEAIPREHLVVEQHPPTLGPDRRCPSCDRSRPPHRWWRRWSRSTERLVAFQPGDDAADRPVGRRARPAGRLFAGPASSPVTFLRAASSWFGCSRRLAGRCGSQQRDATLAGRLMVEEPDLSASRGVVIVAGAEGAMMNNLLDTQATRGRCRTGSYQSFREAAARPAASLGSRSFSAAHSGIRRVHCQLRKRATRSAAPRAAGSLLPSTEALAGPSGGQSYPGGARLEVDAGLGEGRVDDRRTPGNGSERFSVSRSKPRRFTALTIRSIHDRRDRLAMSISRLIS